MYGELDFSFIPDTSDSHQYGSSNFSTDHLKR